jgi:hypothetical protein
MYHYDEETYVLRVWRDWNKRRISTHPSESWWCRLASVAIVLRMPKMPKQTWRASEVEVEELDMDGSDMDGLDMDGLDMVGSDMVG